MKTPNKVLMRAGWQALEGKWRIAIFGILIYMLVSMLIKIPFNLLPENVRWTGTIVSLLISGPLMFGMTLFWLTLSRKENAHYGQLFEGFRTDFFRSMKTYLLMTLYIILWTLLLIVPGIIAALRYSQTFFILADDRTIGVSAALSKSKKMMNGNKWKLLELGLRFAVFAIPFIVILIIIGIHAFDQPHQLSGLLLILPILFILCVVLWVLIIMPFMYVAMAKFYDDVKNSEPTVDVEAGVTTA